jgi:ABC-type transport system involved in multi-copper enzyme maturation permease subunit
VNALWAIVIDTWRQSRNQIVFLIMLVLLAVIGIASFVVPKSFDQPDGTRRIGVVFTDEPSPLLEGAWDAVYVQSKLTNAGESLDPFNLEPTPEQIEQFEAAEREAAAADVPLDQRATEMLANFFASAVFTISMALFVAACAGYMPAMLESGAIDIVLARPARRIKIYLGKILGGLALYTAAIVAVYLLIFLGLGIRTGVWVTGIFLVLPLQLLSAAVLYSLLAALGVISRSSTLCLIVGLVFYFVVDSAIGTLIQFRQLGAFEDGGWMDRIAGAMYWTLPNFGLLKANATASVLNIPVMEWQPFLVAFAWLALTLAVGSFRFQRADF